MSSDKSAVEGSASAARSELDEWLAAPDPNTLASAAGWAREEEDWPALHRLWTDHLDTPDFADPAIRQPFLELPVSARRARPELSVVGALADCWRLPDSSRAEVQGHQVGKDAFEIHSQWRSLDDPDAVAVSAAIWILAALYSRTDSPEVSASRAMQIRREAIEYLEQLRLEGQVCGAYAFAYFRAAAGMAALLDGDVGAAAADCQLAIMTDPSANGAQIACGTRALALALFGADPVASDIPDTRRSGTLPGRGMTAEARTMGHLGAGLTALRRLDQAAVEQELAACEAEVRGAGAWTVFAYLQAMHDWLWGNTNSALTRMDATVAFHSVVTTEQHHKLGRMALGRARAALLIRLGSPASALGMISRIPTPWRAAAEALARLWAGDLVEAKKVADAGVYDPDTLQPDRIELAAIRAAIGLRTNPDSPEIEAEVNSLIEHCVASGHLLAIAQLPRAVRAWIIQIASRANRVEWASSLARLGSINDSEPPWSPVHLTRREQVLLPALATPATAAEIAENLHVSVHTVRSQIATLRAKFDAETRVELVHRARDSGLID